MINALFEIIQDIKYKILSLIIILYKTNKFPHKIIRQVAMIMKVRLKSKKTKTI
jgi:hypothetical protein